MTSAAPLASKRQRKGVNREADPYLSGTYMHRELRGEVKFSEEGRDLRHLARP